MYLLSNLAFVIYLGFFACVFGFGIKRRPNLWQTLPRERMAGEIIAVICLIWSAWYVLPMLEGGMSRYRVIIQLLVPVTAILVYFHLNFLLTRALGGLLLLGTVHLLHWAFVAQPPLRPLYSAVCYAYAFVGMGLIATPWYFRDLLAKATNNGILRTATTAVLAVSALFYLLYAFAG